MGFNTDRIFKNCSTKEQVLRDVETALLNLCENPWLDIMPHPFNLGRIPIPLVPSDFPEAVLHGIADRFARRNKIFEIMNTQYFWFPALTIPQVTKEYIRLVSLFKEHGVRFSVGSDAHSCCGVGNLRWSESIIRTARLESLMIDPLKLFPHTV